MSTLHNILNNIRARIVKIPIAKKYGELLEQKTNFNMENYVVGVGILIAISLFSGFLAEIVSNCIGFVYPMYASIAAIEASSNKGHDLSELRELLTYWVVFGCFLAAENFIEFVVYWIPCYFPIKVTFLLWCMLPEYKGAEKIYNDFIKPTLGEHIHAVERALNNTQATGAKEKVQENETTTSSTSEN